MKQVALPVLLICALTACGKSESPVSDAAVNNESAEKTGPTGSTSSKPDPETQADQFVAMDTTEACLGLYANLAPAEGKKRALVQFAMIRDGEFRKLEGFAREDALKAQVAAFDAAVAPMKGKTLFTYTTTSNDDYREYNMETKSFFDSTQMTWGSNDMMGNSNGNNQLTLSYGDGSCVLRLVNTEAWKGQFKVVDETQARAADAARQGHNGHVRYFLQAVSAEADDSSLDWPRVNAEIVRVELVDNAGNMLARAQPSL